MEVFKNVSLGQVIIIIIIINDALHSYSHPWM